MEVISKKRGKQNTPQCTFQLVCFICLVLEEANVLSKAFDLILTFDDVITQGYRESVTMPQLEAFLEMDSTDEKIFRK